MKLYFSLIAAALLLVGCAGAERIQQQTDDATASAQKQVELAKAAKSVREQKLPLIVYKTGAWLGGKSIPLAADAALPSVFKNEVVFAFPGKANIATVAERITKTVGIPVRVRPDVFLPANTFVTGGQAAAAAFGVAPGGGQLGAVAGVAGGTPQPNVAAQAVGAGMRSPIPGIAGTTVASYNTETEMNYSGPLSGYLDMIAARFGISWEYRSESIIFFRLMTRTFTLNANPGSSNFSSSIGKGAGGRANGNAASATATSTGEFGSQSQVKVESSFSVWDSMEASIKTILSPIGKVSVNQATGTITVTDTKDIVEAVERLVTNENRLLTRQVGLRVQVVSVQTTDANETGIDWQVVYKQLNNLVPDWQVTMASPASLTGVNAGSVGAQIVKQVNSDTGLSQVTGSQAMLMALNSVGKASVLTENDVLTLNRQPVPLAITKQVTYLASTTPAAGSAVGGTSGTPGLTPGTVTTGFLLNMMPTMTDANNVLLSFGIDISSLDRIGTVSTGSGSTLQSINTPETSGMQSMNRVGLRTGETLMLTGFSRVTDQYDKRTLTDNGSIGAGGSFSGKGTRETVIIMITPTTVEGV